MSYLGFRVYEFLTWLCGCDLKWERFRGIAEAKEEISEQMDVRLILKKLNFYDNVTRVLLKEHQILGLYLADPPTIEHHAKMRKVFDESKNIIEQNSSSMNSFNSMYKEERQEKGFDFIKHIGDIASK